MFGLRQLKGNLLCRSSSVLMHSCIIDHQVKNLHFFGNLDLHSNSNSWMSLGCNELWVSPRTEFFAFAIKPLLPFNTYFILFSSFVGEGIDMSLFIMLQVFCFLSLRGLLGMMFQSPIFLSQGSLTIAFCAFEIAYKRGKFFFYRGSFLFQMSCQKGKFCHYWFPKCYFFQTSCFFLL